MDARFTMAETYIKNQKPLYFDVLGKKVGTFRYVSNTF